MKPRYALTTIFVAWGLLAAGPASAELYKWVDDQGNVIYSQVPPADREAARIAPPPPPPANPTPARKLTGNGDEEAEEKVDKAQQEEDARVDKEIARIAKKNCEIAKRNLEIYKTFGRVRNDKGEVTELDDKTRAIKIKDAEKEIKDFCKK